MLSEESRISKHQVPEDICHGRFLLSSLGSIGFASSGPLLCSFLAMLRFENSLCCRASHVSVWGRVRAASWVGGPGPIQGL